MGSVEERPFRAVKKMIGKPPSLRRRPARSAAERANEIKEHVLLWNPHSWASLRSELIERPRIARIWQSNPEPQSCYAIP
jgi:hypothetical protein